MRGVGCGFGVGFLASFSVLGSVVLLWLLCFLYESTGYNVSELVAVMVYR